MTDDEFDETEDDGPIALDVAEYFQLELDSVQFEATIEVRNQLAKLLLESAGTPGHEQNEAICRAIMTTVANLELRLVDARSYAIQGRTHVEKLRQVTMHVYSRLLDLETRILEAGLYLKDPDHESLDWQIYDDADD